MENNYYKAYKEVIEILKYVPKESVDKIPKTMIEVFKNNMDKEYEFYIDVDKNFEEQELLEETKAILANIFRDYWATQYQRTRIIEKEKNDREKIEMEKANRYNPDNIFKRSIKKNEIKNIEQKTSELPIEYKEKFYQRILKFFKKFFNI